jgi:hypothetical protein
MDPEDLNIEAITNERRKAIEQTIEPISVEQLKAVGAKTFQPLTTHGAKHSSSFLKRTVAAPSITPRHTIRCRLSTALIKRRAFGFLPEGAPDRCRPQDFAF